MQLACDGLDGAHANLHRGALEVGWEQGSADNGVQRKEMIQYDKIYVIHA